MSPRLPSGVATSTNWPRAVPSSPLSMISPGLSISPCGPYLLTLSPMSKRTNKRKLRAKKKANHGKKPNCGRG
jgi:hypothetical protein